jgi:hypothetical protein
MFYFTFRLKESAIFSKNFISFNPTLSISESVLCIRQLEIKNKSK